MANERIFRWRVKESTLFMVKQIMDEFNGENRVIMPNVARAYIDHVQTVMHDSKFYLIEHHSQ